MNIIKNAYIKNLAEQKHGLTRKLKHWWKKGSIVLADQLVFSGGNFLVNILLARWLPLGEYGAFATTYSAFYLLSALHNSFITEPMLVFGVKEYSSRFQEYQGFLFYSHWLISGVLSLLFFLAALIFKQSGSLDFGESLKSLAIAAPFILFFWFGRRSFYVFGQCKWALIGSTIYSTLLIGGIILFQFRGWLSLSSAFMLTGTSAVVAGIFLLTVMRPALGVYAWKSLSLDIIFHHWEYGRWNILASVFYWASGQILLVIMPIFIDLEASAIWAAMVNLYRPVSLFMQSSPLLFLPALSASANDEVVLHKAKTLSWLFGGSVFLYSILLSVLSTPILNLLYAGKYNDYGILVPIFGVAITASASAQIFSIALKAQGKVKYASQISRNSAIVLVVVAIPMILVAGIIGAVGALAIGYVVAAVTARLKIREWL